MDVGNVQLENIEDRKLITGQQINQYRKELDKVDVMKITISI